MPRIIEKIIKQKVKISGLKINKKKLFIINDAYNASLESMKIAIDNLLVLKKHNAQSQRAVCVIGDMLELGDHADRLHNDLADYLLSKPIDVLFTIGEKTKLIYDKLLNKISCEHFQNSQSAVKIIRNKLENHDIILFKGSQGMDLKYIINKLYV